MNIISHEEQQRDKCMVLGQPSRKAHRPRSGILRPLATYAAMFSALALHSALSATYAGAVLHNVC